MVKVSIHQEVLASLNVHTQNTEMQTIWNKNG
jgi:hypothetical protein